MKKLIEKSYKAQLSAQILIMSIAFVMFLFSCNKETPQPTPTCNCDYVTYISWDFSDYEFVEWQRQESSITDCWKHGEIISEVNEIQNGYPSIKRKVIECE